MTGPNDPAPGIHPTSALSGRGFWSGYLPVPRRVKNVDLNGRTGTIDLVVHVLLYAFMLMAHAHGHAQERIHHVHMLPNGVEGSVDKGYRIARGDTVLSGGWHFRASHHDTGEQDMVRSWEFSGTYDQGLPAGEWYFSAKKLRSMDAPVVQGYQLVLNTVGNEHLVTANFSNGKAAGTWQVLDHDINGGVSSDTLLHVESMFAEGRLSGPFRANAPRGSVTGVFLPGGLVHGEWRFVHSTSSGAPIIEIRNYERGELLDHNLMRGDLRLSITHPGLEMDASLDEVKFIELDLDRAYLDLLALTAVLPEAADLDTQGPIVPASNALLLKSLDGSVLHDGHPIWEQVPEGRSPQGARVRLPYHPYTEDEQRARAQLIRDHAAAMELIDGFMQDPVADVGQHAFTEVAHAMAVLGIYRAHLEDLRTVVAVLEHPLGVHLQREILLTARVAGWQPDTAVDYTFKETQLSGTHLFPRLNGPGGMTVTLLQHHLAQVVKEIKVIRRRCDPSLDHYRAQGLLVKKEEHLVHKRDSLLALYGNAMDRSDHNDYHAEIAGPIIDMTTRRFKEYAALDADGKLERIDPLLDLYRQALDLYGQVALIPLRTRRIEDAYTRSVWNPYTYTFMDERVKERLYKTYETVLLPYLRDELRGSLEGDRPANATDGFAEVYRLMLDLREQDTKELERDLRRVTDATQVLVMLRAAASPIPRPE